MDKFIFGQYIPGTSVVHRMTPASKLLLCLLFIVMTLISNDWLNYGELLLLIIISVMAAKISFRTIYHGVKPLVLIILVTAVLQLLFDPQGHVWFHLGIITLTRGGLRSSSFVFARFLLIILISTLLTLSTSPTNLASGIRLILNPLRYIKVPVDTISLMISVALRFIPTLDHEFRTIVKAQRSRGMLFRQGSILSRIKKIAALIIPLLFGSFEKAQKLSYAMLSRGYQNNVHRSQIHRESFSWLDGVAWVIYLFFSGLMIMTRV